MSDKQKEKKIMCFENAYRAGIAHLKMHGIKVIQVEWEIKTLLEQVNKLKPTRIVEIGSRHGGTLYLFSKFAGDYAHLVAIDPNPSANLSTIKEHITYPHNNKVAIIPKISQSEYALDFIKDTFPEGIDLLHIDGSHKYDDVKSDFERYWPLVRPGGLIAIHDIKGAGAKQFRGQVKRFWTELKGQIPDLVEEICAPDQEFYGIGLVHKLEKEPHPKNYDPSESSEAMSKSLREDSAGE